MQFRAGIGYDLHRLVPGRRLILGGVEIDHDHGLLGHSDADVVLHAIADAILGAAALGDIGDHFPDTDPAFRGADSAELLRQILSKVQKSGFVLCNLDTVIHAEAPKLADQKQRIRQSIAAIVGLDPSAVSVKATTNEGLDAIGRGMAIACFATAMVAQTSAS
ncbi:MAG: 2-C-methyl-D-erythritol 2,4-cyclodiphosphate synthase [Phycisphaerae bacterium]